MSEKKSKNKKDIQAQMPSAEEVAQELGKATSIDDFYGKDGVFARLFSKTIEEMLDAELTAELGYERYEAEGRNSGNSRNGSYTRKLLVALWQYLESGVPPKGAVVLNT